MALQLASDSISAEHATELLLEYSRRFPGTLRYYDYAGQWPNRPAPDDTFSLADVGRLVVINGRPSSADVVALLRPVDPQLWADVPVEADFRELPQDPTGDPVYQAVDRLYGALRARKGLGSTKVTKALHLKRPHLVPIVDSVVRRHYAEPAERLAKDSGATQPQYWRAVWADARANASALEAARGDLRSDHETGVLVADLPLLRLHDILVWMHFLGTTG